MRFKQIEIINTTEKDLNHIASLWNDGEVMFYVGFPNGLGISIDKLRNSWLPNININNKRKHYSIYHDELGYCGETYYEVMPNHKAALDIKLFSNARGKGIAYIALNYAIASAFNIGLAHTVYVDPHKKNAKAITLYKRLGFVEHPHPDPKYAHTHYYFELSKESFNLNKGKDNDD